VIPSREAHFRKVHDVKAAREDLGASMVLNTSWQRSGDQARIKPSADRCGIRGDAAKFDGYS